MINKLRKTIKKHPKLRRILVSVRNYLFRYVKDGYYKKMLCYFFFERKRDLNSLEEYGFKNCKIYNTRFWRRHDGLDDVSRRFYCAYYEQKKVFIKLSKNDSTMQNEIRISEYIQDFNISFIAKPKAYKINFSNGFDMLAIEFFDTLKSYRLPKTKDEFAMQCIQLEKMLEGLKNAGVVHADIHKNNLMIDGNNELKIVDFGISYSKNVFNSVNYLARPGTFFTEPDNCIRIYDDAYSVVKMIESFNPSDEFLKIDEFLRIKNKIGKFTAEIDMSKFMTA